MNLEIKSKLLREYCRQIFPHGDLESMIPEVDIVETAVREAELEGLPSVNPTHVLKKLDSGAVLDYAESDVLEAIILPKMRPVVDILNDSFAIPPNPWIPHWNKADPPEEIETNQVDQPVKGQSGSPTIRGDQRAVLVDRTATWTIPLKVSVSLGCSTGGDLFPTISVTPEAAGYRIDPDPDYVGRPGYDEYFLGSNDRIRIPWLSEDNYRDVAFNRLAHRRLHLLPYHHFSVVMSRSRRLAFLTAVNIDGTRERSLSRDDFSDKWFSDPRIADSEQIENELYYSNPLDRGHLVRRLDPTLGSVFHEASLAHDDTFHWTNCSPQHEGFNRNKTTWGGIENYILRNANVRDLKVTVFTGPVFREDDPEYETTKGEMIQLPLDYWKVVAMVKSIGELSATAYLVSQKPLIDDLMTEAFVYGPYRSLQTSITRLEELTGLTFRDLEDVSKPAFVSQDTYLRSFMDIVL